MPGPHHVGRPGLRTVPILSAQPPHPATLRQPARGAGHRSSHAHEWSKLGQDGIADARHLAEFVNGAERTVRRAPRHDASSEHGPHTRQPVQHHIRGQVQVDRHTGSRRGTPRRRCADRGRPADDHLLSVDENASQVDRISGTPPCDTARRCDGVGHARPQRQSDQTRGDDETDDMNDDLRRRCRLNDGWVRVNGHGGGSRRRHSRKQQASPPVRPR